MKDTTKEDVINVLKFYADEYNYAPDISEMIGVENGISIWAPSAIAEDEGEKARTLLKQLEARPQSIEDQLKVLESPKHTISSDQFDEDAAYNEAMELEHGQY